MEKKEVKKWQDEEALKRYQMIALLLDPDMDEGKRQQLREEAAEKNGVSKRTLYRYEKSYREEGFGGLRPASRTKQRQQRLPENFGETMEQAVQLKREVPKRSVRQIIKVLELEGFAEPGAPDGAFTGGHQVRTRTADNGRGTDKNLFILPDRRPFQIYRAVRVL